KLGGFGLSITLTWEAVVAVFLFCAFEPQPGKKDIKLFQKKKKKKKKRQPYSFQVFYDFIS
ncbi:hypothetical protein NPS74_22825, partial [Cutibacterium acnes subsp. acnes]|nr:hypothetical protein [Cutibacterium acnes subsp. acnes]